MPTKSKSRRRPSLNRSSRGNEALTHSAGHPADCDCTTCENRRLDAFVDHACIPAHLRDRSAPSAVSPSEILAALRAWKQTLIDSYSPLISASPTLKFGPVTNPKILHEIACIDAAIAHVTVLRDIDPRQRSAISDQLSPWASVKESLPPYRKLVLVCNKLRCLYIAFYAGATWFDECAEPLRIRVTHWTPLPEPPQ